MSRNDVTGDRLVTKVGTSAYSEGWDRIFGKKPKVVELVVTDEELRRIEQDARRAKWHKWLQDNQKSLDRIPSFQEWAEQHNV